MNKEINIFVENLDENTKKQFELCYKENFVLKAALMPDAHYGYVAPIGSVFLTKNVIVPSWIGFDIGCGVLGIRIIHEELNSNELINLIKKKGENILMKSKTIIPMGKDKVSLEKDVSEITKKNFKNIFKELQNKIKLPQDVYKIIKSKGISNLGSLGSGNHFIEISKSTKDNSLWIIIHSGSRNIGKKIALKYMKLAAKNEETFENNSHFDITSEKGKEYFEIVNFLQKYALLNRKELGLKVIKLIEEIIGINNIKINFEINKNHNFIEKIDENKFLHRKGATSSNPGELGIIPANMKDGSFIVKGKGNEKYLFSSSHGAGRKLSRNEAKKKINLIEFKKNMKGIFAFTDEEFLDESPEAYKEIYSVLDFQKESIDIIDHLTPIINLKG